MGPAWRLVNWFGRTPAGVWTIKQLVSPLDRRLYRRTGGRLVTTGRPHGPIVLLTTTGRRTGHQHTTPVFHLQDGQRVILCNVTPGGERPNPWPSTCEPIPGAGAARRPGPHLSGACGHRGRAGALLAPAHPRLAGV